VGSVHVAEAFTCLDCLDARLGCTFFAKPFQNERQSYFVNLIVSGLENFHRARAASECHLFPSGQQHAGSLDATAASSMALLLLCLSMLPAGLHVTCEGGSVDTESKASFVFLVRKGTVHPYGPGTREKTSIWL
jgi:hypothetical protein